MNKRVKITVQKAMVKPVVVYGRETWPMTAMDMKRLNAWERKILRRIYGPMVEEGLWRIRSNQELRELYKYLDIITGIK
jgi:hypothetical protein